MIEYVKKADVLDIINSPLPRDIAVDYLYELKGVWLDEEEKTMTNTYLGKPVEINEHGNNAAIKVHILDEATMKLNGFKRFISGEDNWWYFCNRVYKDITFNMTIYDSGDWMIDILDECFLQPYDYQAMYERGNRMPVLLTVKRNVDEIMDSFVHKGIISGWEVGDYI